MLMGKQMILTILIVSLTFGTESEFQIRIIQLCASADGAFMSCDLSLTGSSVSGIRCTSAHTSLSHLTAEIPFPLHLMRRIGLHISRQQEEDNKVQ